ncbi:pyrroloquinoline quinone biosynthesis protein PqqB [Pollutimonas nitritireducens]|uniref:Coenzyme PQQ synthesis protein B n=1 Tax=Pollutimonas nitritireducens TaxID=2045209 RepID=A0A2N4UFZ3_9BURK|nr:pyrroloquinoline quinone biosynthesis protein PqqB [Pollutimonas nitritireducens]PLC53915.1 pyrroloquinoline quinone biosynthesis protein PqqB [Pollutimonas nitritireducens]
MKVIVLGSAAGGGFPQWNCNCPNCDGMRKGAIQAKARTQSSIAVSDNGKEWVLINASPDILAQIRATPALQPGRSIRDTGIVAVMLMDAQIDHVTGLLMLREGKPIPLYCTASVWDDLSTGLPLTNVLSHYCGVEWKNLLTDTDQAQAIQVPGVANISFTALPLKSKAPPYSPRRNSPEPGDNVGLLIENTITGKKLFYAPGLGEIEPHIKNAMREADCVLVDGTLWTEDEMIRLGLSKKTSADMGHLPQSGPGGMIEILDTLGSQRKILIHINNSNPILNENSEQAAILKSHEIEVAFDGMEINL